MESRTEREYNSRRNFIRNVTIAGIGSGITLLSAHAGENGKESESKDASHETHDDEVAPGEDLMREHGVLKRVLMIYEEDIRRIENNIDLPPECIAAPAGLIRSFIEDYHEKLEEDFLFPRFKKANKLVDLVDVLIRQHQAGRKVTDITLQLSNMQSLKNRNERRTLVGSLREFIRMYSPHEAREDTVLFPAFRELVTAHEYAALGEDFEKKEQQLFGEDGFEKIVDQVSGIERKLGIYDLDQFTPKMQ